MLVLPEDLPEACFAVYYRPLETVGGDFYDVVPLSIGVIGYFVAGIGGHGVAASFLTSAVKALLRQCSSPLRPAEQTMRAINAVMRETLHDGHYLTASYVWLDRRELKLSIVNAGHPPLIHVSYDGQTASVAVAGDPLGEFPGGVFNSGALRPRPTSSHLHTVVHSGSLMSLAQWRGGLRAASASRAQFR